MQLIDISRNSSCHGWYPHFRKWIVGAAPSGAGRWTCRGSQTFCSFPPVLSRTERDSPSSSFNRVPKFGPHAVRGLSKYSCQGRNFGGHSTQKNDLDHEESWASPQRSPFCLTGLLLHVVWTCQQFPWSCRNKRNEPALQLARVVTCRSPVDWYGKTKSPQADLRIQRPAGHVEDGWKTRFSSWQCPVRATSVCVTVSEENLPGESRKNRCRLFGKILFVSQIFNQHRKRDTRDTSDSWSGLLHYSERNDHYSSLSFLRPK